MPWLAALAPLVGGVAYFFGRPTAEALATRPAAMTICPWGITGSAPVGWNDIGEITHHVETERNGRVEVHHSVLRVRVGEERFVGKCLSDSYLDALDALLPIYQAESALPLALGLSSTADRVAARSRDAFHQLLTAARAFLQSAEGRALSEENATSYRGASRTVRPETVLLLSRLLLEKAVGVDRGPLAAVLAAELGIVEMIDELLALTMSPHPFVAAIARAAASRLGAHPSRSFPIFELTPFLGEAQVDAMSAWSKETRAPSGT